jgi:hypothetical protein
MRPIAANRKPNYFDVKGFLDSQVAELTRRQPVVEKQVRLRDGKVETTRVTKTDWSKELQIFYQADINKPALRGAYEVLEHSNFEGVARIIYNAKATSESAVKSLLVETRVNSSIPQLIAARIEQDNPLFYSEKKLLLLVDNGRITEYKVYGIQKLVMFDTVRYSVQTRVMR